MDAIAMTSCSVGLGAWATLVADGATVAGWRKQPFVIRTETKPASLLKNADDQTVVALRTVLSAIERAGWQTQSFADWGILAGGSFFGRGATAEGLRKFRAEGAWAVSPHLIPNHSLHAPSGTLSHLLGTHGPNFGAGSGADTTADALLLATTLLTDGTLPGVWVVLTHYEPEWLPHADAPPTSATCRSVALALTATASNSSLTIVRNVERLPGLGVGLLAEGLAKGSGRWSLCDSLTVALRMNGEGRP